MTATASAIRDRITTLISAQTPTLLASDAFRPFRNELAADFRDWAEKNPAGAFRRFQVRESSVDGEPETSNVTVEQIRVTFEVIVAYPQTHRYGPDNALDRDDVANEDWKAIKWLIGATGRENFSGSYDCTPLGASRAFERGDSGIDYSVITAEFMYYRSAT